MKRLQQIRDTLSRSWVFWAASISFALYVPLWQESQTGGGAMARMAAGHWTACAAGVAFVFALTALVFRLYAIQVEKRVTAGMSLELPPTESTAESPWDGLLNHLAQFAGATVPNRVTQRLIAALRFIKRQAGTHGLDQELGRLADQETQRSRARQTPLKLLNATVALCGTAGAAVNVGLPATVPADSVSFAIALAVVLLFARYGAERYEETLLADVDERVKSELTGRFAGSGAPLDPHIAALRQQLQVSLDASEQLVAKQVALWQQALDAAQTRWHEQGEAVAQRMAQALTAALKNAAAAHQSALSEGAKSFALQQEILIKHTAALSKLGDSSQQIQGLQQTLNQNLTAITGARNFEQTVLRLAAAVQMLSARLTPKSSSDSARQAA